MKHAMNMGLSIYNWEEDSQQEVVTIGRGR